MTVLFVRAFWVLRLPVEIVFQIVGALVDDCRRLLICGHPLRRTELRTVLVFPQAVARNKIILHGDLLKIVTQLTKRVSDLVVMLKKLTSVIGSF